MMRDRVLAGWLFAMSCIACAPGAEAAEFVILVGPDGGETVQLLKGELTVTTKTSQVITMTDPCKVLIIDALGNPRDGGCVAQPMGEFTSLGEPITTTALADAWDAFNAIAGGFATAGLGGAGSGSGGTGSGGTTTPFSTTGGFSLGGTVGLITSVGNTNPGGFTLTFTSPGGGTTTTTTQQVSGNH